jgi:hypothetical protein
MQLTIQQLKTAVLEQVSADWVRQNHGKLTLKSTWQAAYDRCQEFIAAKVDEALKATQGSANEIIETTGLLVEHAAIAAQDVIAETMTYDNLVNGAFAATATTQKALWRLFEAVVLAAVFCYLFIIEWRESGSIARLQRDMAEYQQRQELEGLFGLEIDPMLLHRRHDLAIASSLPLRGLSA